MRLLVVTQYFWPEEFRVNDLVLGLRDRGHDVTVLTGLPNYPQGRVFETYRANPAAFESYEGVRVIRSPLIGRGRGRAIGLLLNYLSFALCGAATVLFRLSGKKFDAALVFQTSPITAAIPALVAKKVTGAPILLWVQDLWPDTLSAIGVIRSSRLLGLVGGLVRWIYRGCDRILVQSRAFEPKVRQHAGKATPIEYFPNWFEPMYSDSGAAEEPAPELGAFSDTFNVMFAGNLGEAQDLPTIAKAAALCRDLEQVRWLIVGDGRAKEKLQLEVRRLGLEDRVHLLGRYPSARMPSFFRGAGALLVSLRPEPIWAMTVPSKVQNYMAAGLPVLGMLDGEGARVIEEAACGLTSPAGDAEALASSVRAMVASSREVRERMGRNGCAYANAHFRRDRLFDNLEVWLSETSVGDARPQ